MDFKGIFFNPNDFSLTERKLGKGTFGTVFLVENKKDKNLYAAKICKTDISIDGNDQTQIMRESTILSKFNHPSILKFLGVNFRSLKDPSKYQPTIITEYLSRGSLKVILDKEKQSIADTNWTPTKKYICLIGIANAMKYLHDHGVIHRDLKPENILMDENYYPRISDFGLSRCFPHSISQSMNLAMTGQIGTPLYMAPELIEEEGYGPGVDVYAFAILAYEILTGKQPFCELGNNISGYKLFKKVESGIRPTFDDSVPKKMQELISNCWDGNTNNRPSFKIIYEILTSDFSLSPEDVDEDEINEYIDIIKFDENEVALNSNSTMEKEILELKNDINELKEKNEENLLKISKIEKKNEQLQKGNNYLKEQNEEHYKTVFKYIKENQRNKNGINCLKDHNNEYNKMIQLYTKKNQQLSFMNDLTKQLIQNMTVQSFNALPIKSQLYIISQLYPILNDKEIRQFYLDLEYLITYIKPFVTFDDPCIRIDTNDDDYLRDVKNTSIIQINSCATQCLFESDYFNLEKFQQNISNFSEIIIEIDYTSESLKNITNIAKQIKNIKIGINFSQPKKECDMLWYDKMMVIMSPKFENNADITYIKGNISNFSFKGCSSLKKVEINSLVIAIKYNMFEQCISLTHILLPSSVTAIGDHSFAECKSLKQITIPSSVTYIGFCAFYNCSSLTQIMIPSSVTAIGISAFANCSSLKQMSIPSSITLINSKVFSNCSSLEQISMPSSITKINDYAFYKCIALKQILIPTSVTSIDEYAFSNCESLAQILFPSSLTKIGRYAFMKCTSLTQIAIPSSVTSIEECAFSECSSLTQLSIPSSITSIGNNAFSGCPIPPDPRLNRNTRLEMIDLLIGDDK